MSKPKILVTTQMMIHDQSRFLKWLGDDGFDVEFVMNEQFLDEKSCLNLAPIYDGWIAGDDQITSNVIDHLTPCLKIISKWGSGIDSIDVEYALKNEVIIKNSPGAFKNAVSEIAVGYLLLLSRGLLDTHKQVIDGYWPKKQYIELVDANIGIIGLGAIGSSVAEKLVSFGSNIYYYDPCVNIKKFVKKDFNEILKISDFLIFACGLNNSTKYMLNKKNIAHIKKGAYVINVGRGPVIEEEALIKGFEQKKILGAALDVYEKEPLDKNSKLKNFNTIFGSHNANNTYQAVEKVHKLTIENLNNFFNL